METPQKITHKIWKKKNVRPLSFPYQYTVWKR